MSWSFEQELPRLLNAVNTAPSIFSERPWELQVVADDRIELYAVPHPVLGNRLIREIVISCGAALYNLRLAIQVGGRDPAVLLLPALDRGSGLLSTVTPQRTLLASLEVTQVRPDPPSDAEQERYEAMWLRRTDDAPYQYIPVPLPILVEMEESAAHERAWLRTLTRGETRHLLHATVQASGELEGTLSGLTTAPTAAEIAAFEHHPQIMTLSSDDDRPLDWLRTGEALQHALLTGTRFSMSVPYGRSAGYRRQLQFGPLDPHRLRPRVAAPAGYAVEASFLTQILELADLEGRPRAWPWRTNYTEVPQVAIRVGYAPVAAGDSDDDETAAPLRQPAADERS